MEQKMTISVVVSTYNGSRYVDEQIESIVNQQLPPSQIIISDDCSTDDTWEKLKKWQQQFPNLIEIHRQVQNVGYNKNFEFALSKVKCDYIALSDQDDIWHLDKLKELVGAVQLYPTANVFHHDEAAIGKQENLNINHTYWLPYEGNGVGILFVLNKLTGHKLFFSSKLLSQILPFPDGVIYDWWINVVVAVHGNTRYVNQKLMDFRLHEESAYFSDVSLQLKDVTKPIVTALNAFATIKGISAVDRNYLERFRHCYKNHQSHKFDIRLFFFLCKNRNVFFKDFHTPFKGVKRKIFLVRLCRAFSKW